VFHGKLVARFFSEVLVVPLLLISLILTTSSSNIQTIPTKKPITTITRSLAQSLAQTNTSTSGVVSIPPPSATSISPAKPEFTPIVWSPVPVPTTELTKANAEGWSVESSDQKTTTVQNDFNLTKLGKASIKLQTDSSFDVNLRYQLLHGNFGDLSNIQYSRLGYLPKIQIIRASKTAHSGYSLANIIKVRLLESVWKTKNNLTSQL
jgi:hypothetical protein